MPLPLLLICVLLVGCSAFLSSSEAALFSLSRYQIRSLRDRVPRAHRTIKRLTADPAGLLMTLLVSNEVLNVAISTIITGTVFNQRATWIDSLPRFGLPEWALQSLAGGLVTAPVILILCEITPKAIGARANQTLAILFSGPIATIYDALAPARFVARWALESMRFRVQGERADLTNEAAEDVERKLQEEDFLVMAEEGHREGTIQESELDLIRNVFDLDDTTVAEIQTPFSQVTTVLETLPVKDAMRLTQTWRFSRIPVLSRDRRQVAGLLYRKDLLLSRLTEDPSELHVSDVMRKPLVVQSTAKLNSVFRKLKMHQTHIAIVEGPGQVPTGIVTMADVLGELFDDLFEELPS